MKLTVLAILSLYLSIHTVPVIAQTRLTGQQMIKKRCGSQRARLWTGKYGQKYAELFHDIRILDARPDTARIGIVRTGERNQDEILLESPVADQVPAYRHEPVAALVSGYLEDTYTRPGGNHALLIVLKNLWIATPDSLIFTHGFKVCNIYFRVEAYLQAKNGFMPLILMDTTLRELTGGPAAAIAEQEILALFDEFMDRIATKDLDKERRIVSAEQIDSFNRTRYAYPMDTATNLEKGAYASYEEFLNNAPAIANAELSTDKESHLLLSVPDQNGRLIYTHTVWGYCDGSRAYAMADGDLLPIFNVHHQFYADGPKEYHIKVWHMPYLNPADPAGMVRRDAPDIPPVAVKLHGVYRIDNSTGNVMP
jgi:hypothetical protein